VPSQGMSTVRWERVYEVSIKSYSNGPYKKLSYRREAHDVCRSKSNCVLYEYRRVPTDFPAISKT
jgi:hypothetical protein